MYPRLTVPVTFRRITHFFRTVRNVDILYDHTWLISDSLRLQIHPFYWQFQFVIRMNVEEYFMAFTRSVFANITLETSERENVEKWVTKEKVTAFTTLMNLLGDGFKISCSWVVDSNAFCFSIIGTDTTRQNKNMVMTTWSDDFEEVILLAGYKHYVKCGGGSWPTADSGQRWG